MPVNHGLASTYKVYGCRCDLCRQAAVDYNREWRRKRQVKQPPALSRREHMRMYRAMLRHGAYEYGVHNRRVTILRKPSKVTINTPLK